MAWLARADRGHALGSSRIIHVEHDSKRAARLEGAGALKQLQFQKHLGIWSKPCSSVLVIPLPHRCLYDVRLDSLPELDDVADYRRCSHGDVRSMCVFDCYQKGNMSD